MLHAWTMDYQHMMLCVCRWIHTKAESQRSAGEDRQAAFATSGWTNFSRMPTLYAIYAVEIWDRHGSLTEWRNGPLGLRDDDDDDDDDIN